MDAPLIIVSGAYGSGKTEFAINLAARTREAGEDCVLVDMDVVNPYFRTRDVRDLFARRGISVIAPEGQFAKADVPMLSPKIGGSLTMRDRTVILDVGGDKMGARVLGRYCGEISVRQYSMILVNNTRRPGSRDAEGAMAQMDDIQHLSQLAFTEIVSNSHLMDETDQNIVMEGVAAAQEIALARDLLFNRVCILEGHENRVDAKAVGREIFILKKFMKKPWEIF